VGCNDDTGRRADVGNVSAGNSSEEGEHDPSFREEVEHFMIERFVFAPVVR